MTIDPEITNCGADPTANPLIRTAQQHRTLEDIVAWIRTDPTNRSIAEIVTQDEFTHDVVLSEEGGRFLVYDTS